MLAGVLSPFVRAWVAQGNRIEALQTDIDQREERLADLQLAEQRWQDPNYVTAQARKRFTYVMPGEIGYVVLDTPRVVADKQNPSGAAARAVSESKASWVSSVWGSVEEAGQARASEGESEVPGGQGDGAGEADTSRTSDTESTTGDGADGG